jgi:hypothetical protein
MAHSSCRHSQGSPFTSHRGPEQLFVPVAELGAVKFANETAVSRSFAAGISSGMGVIIRTSRSCALIKECDAQVISPTSLDVSRTEFFVLMLVEQARSPRNKLENRADRGQDTYSNT